MGAEAGVQLPLVCRRPSREARDRFLQAPPAGARRDRRRLQGPPAGPWQAHHRAGDRSRARLRDRREDLRRHRPGPGLTTSHSAGEPHMRTVALLGSRAAALVVVGALAVLSVGSSVAAAAPASADCASGLSGLGTAASPCLIGSAADLYEAMSAINADTTHHGAA